MVGTYCVSSCIEAYAEGRGRGDACKRYLQADSPGPGTGDITSCCCHKVFSLWLLQGSAICVSSVSSAKSQTRGLPDQEDEENTM